MINKERCLFCLQTLFKHHCIIFMFVLAAKVTMQAADYGCDKRNRNPFWIFCVSPHATEKFKLV